jgi:hypothetical protein
MTKPVSDSEGVLPEGVRVKSNGRAANVTSTGEGILLYLMGIKGIGVSYINLTPEAARQLGEDLVRRADVS